MRAARATQARTHVLPRDDGQQKSTRGSLTPSAPMVRIGIELRPISVELDPLRRSDRMPRNSSQSWRRSQIPSTMTSRRYLASICGFSRRLTETQTDRVFAPSLTKRVNLMFRVSHRGLIQTLSRGKHIPYTRTMPTTEELWSRQSSMTSTRKSILSSLAKRSSRLKSTILMRETR